MQHYSPDADSLMAVLRRLRAPDGCPWDRKQTRKSLVKHFVSECGEFIEAIDNEDPPHICEEAGDVLMNVLFQVAVAEENGEFELKDVWRNIIDKMVRRHAHVFGDEHADTPEEVMTIWQRIKAQEKSDSDTPAKSSLMDSVKFSLSSLERAEKLQKKAAEVKFDWSDTAGIIAKIREELDEFEEAVKQGDETHADMELGDLLFAVTNLARFRDRGTSEELLRAANRKFEARFRKMEELISADNRDFESADADYLNEMWNAAKRSETQL